MSDISLSSLMTPSKTVDVDFPGYHGFSVSLCYLAREELLKLRKKCVTQKFDRKTRQPVESLDEEKFLTEYVKAVIKGWSGFKFRFLQDFLLVDVSGQDPDGELPYNQENAELLMKNSTLFDEWVTETVSDLENFTTSRSTE